MYIIKCKLPNSLIYGDSASAFSPLTRLKELVIESSGLKSPPIFENSGANFKLLQSISLADNEILELRQRHLSAVKSLAKLDLRHNNMSHLTEYSLPQLALLVSLDLSNNPLQNVYPFAFSNLTNLRQLWIGADEGEMRIFHDSLHGLSQLHELHVTGVVFDEAGLGGEYLQALTSLTKLKFAGRLESIAADSFADNKRLQVLDLSHCRLRQVNFICNFKSNLNP